MDRYGPDARGLDRGFPRRRGDGPLPTKLTGHSLWFSPQARGWTARPHAHPLGVLVFPAGAGMDLARSDNTARWISFPRRRGDGPPGPLA